MSLINGIFLGILITISLEIYILHYIYSLFVNRKSVKNNTNNNNINELSTKNEVIKEQSQEEEDERNSESNLADKEAWPPKIVEYLENCLFPQYNDKSNPPTECCTWINVVFARYFLELRKAKEFKERMKKKLNDKFARKLKNNSYIQSITLTDIDLGEVCPYFKGVRVKKSSSEKLEVNLEMEMEYSGAPNCLSFNLDIKLVKGIFIPVKIKLLTCNGTLLIVVPYLKDPTLFGATFLNNPYIDMSIEVLSNKFKDKKKRYLLTPILSVINKFMKSFFLEYWTLPAIRTFDLPLVAPKIPIYVYVSDSKLNNTNVPPPAIQSTKRHANNQKSLDIILDETFPIYTHVSSRNASMFNEKLTSTFLYLAKENNNDIYKLLEKRQSLDQNPLNYEVWKTIKNKHGIHVQKKLLNEYGERGCIFKGTFVVKMNPKDVYDLIINMSNEASGYIFSDTFIRTSILKRFNDDTLVRHISFKLNRQQNHGYVLFEAHKEIIDEDQDEDTLEQSLPNDKPIIITENINNSQKKYVIVWRSIAGIKNDETQFVKADSINTTITNSTLVNSTLNNTNGSNLSLSKERLRSYTTNDIMDKGKKDQLINSINKPIISEEDESKDDNKLSEPKTPLLNDNTYLKVDSASNIKRENISSNSYFTINSISKNEMEASLELLLKQPLLTEKFVESPSIVPREIGLKKNENVNDTKNEPIKNDTKNESVKNDTKNEPVKNDTKNEPVKNDTKNESVKNDTKNEPVKNDTKNESVKDDTKNEPVIALNDINNIIKKGNEYPINYPIPDNSDNEHVDTLDLMVTSSKDDIISVENFKINDKPAGMFKLSLSDDEETPYDIHDSESSSSSLVSLSERFEDTIMVADYALTEKKSSDKLEMIEGYNTSLLDSEKTMDYSQTDSKSINVSEIKSTIYKDNSLDSNDGKKDELFENINAMFIKGFYLESQLGDPESCYLTVISQFEPSFKKFEANYEYCRKLKKYLDDHNTLVRNNITTNNNVNPNSLDEEKQKAFRKSISTENMAKLGKIKNYISNGLVKVKRSHSSMKDANKPSLAKHDNLNNKVKPENISPPKLKLDNISNPDELTSNSSPINDIINNETNENLGNDLISPSKYSPSSNPEELSKSIPVPPTSSMPNATATSANSQSSKKGVKNIFRRVHKAVTKRSSSVNNSNGNISEDQPHMSPRMDDAVSNNLYLSDICQSTDSVNSLDDEKDNEKEKDIHTKNNVVILKHVNKPNIPLNKQNFTNQFINNKETIKVESQHLGGETWNDLRFEFNEAKNLPLDFSISFKPVIPSTFDKWKHIYNESPIEPGVFIIIPTYTCNSSQTLKIINGCVNIYNFPPGSFILKWENNARKTPKHISFRFAIQPVTLLCSPHNTLSQYCNEYNSVVSIRQRSCSKFSVPYIPLNDMCYKSIGISGGTAFLNYQIYTKGSDIQFGIIYDPLYENSLISQDLQQNQETLSTKKHTLNRKANSLTNITNIYEEQKHTKLGEENVKLKLSDETLSKSKGDMLNLNEGLPPLSNDVHTTIISNPKDTKDVFELKPNQRYVVPIAKCNSHKNVLNGTIPISNKFGIYTFIFNNSFSLVTSKTLELNIKLLIL